MTMTEEQIKEVLAGVQYKPGSRFYVERWAYGAGIQDVSLILCLEVRTLDVVTKTSTVLTFRKPMLLSGCADAQDVLRQCRQTAHRWEEHESDEWLTYHGAKPFDPHRDEQTALMRRQMDNLAALVVESLEYGLGNRLKDGPPQPKDPHQ